MAAKLFNEANTSAPDLLIEVKQSGDSVKVTSVDEYGDWLKDLFEITQDGILLFSHANEANIKTDKNGYVIVKKD